MSENENVGAVGAEPVMPPKKVASSPGSQWATGKRTNVKGFDKTPGFSRGCRVTKRTVSTTSEKTAK
jgi:hypothetical protein